MSEKMPSSVLSRSSENVISSPFFPSFPKAELSFCNFWIKAFEVWVGGFVCQASDSPCKDVQSGHRGVFALNSQGAAARVLGQGPNAAASYPEVGTLVMAAPSWGPKFQRELQSLACCQLRGYLAVASPQLPAPPPNPAPSSAQSPHPPSSTRLRMFETKQLFLSPGLFFFGI